MLLFSVLLIIVFFVLAFATALPFFNKPETGSSAISDFLIISYSGAVLLILASVLLRMAGIQEYYVYVLPIVNLAVFRHRFLNIRFKLNYTRIGLHFVLFSILNFNFFVQALRMGLGNYPHEFYNVDSAAYMGLLHGYAKTINYPPLNLELLGASFRYHYGAIGFAALISNFALLKLHTSMFLVVAVFSSLVQYAVIYKISERVINSKNGYLPIIATIMVMILLNFCTNSVSIRRNYHFIFKMGFFGKGFPMLSGLTANCILSICIYMLLFLRNKTEVIMLCILAPSIIFFKLPYYPILFGAFCLYAGFLFFRQKERWPLWALPASLVVSIVLVLFFSLAKNFSQATDRGTNKILLTFNSGFVINSMIELAILLIPLLYAFKKKKHNPAFVFLACFLLANLLVGTFVQVNNPDYSQVFQTMFFVSVMLLVPIVLSSIIDELWWVKLIAFLNWGIPSIAVIVSFIFYGYSLFANKNATHEYCDNRRIAKALEHIPVNGTLLMANDLRYPANNFERKDKQFQLTGVFGHQCLFSSRYFITKEAETNYQAGKEISMMLQQPKWNDTLNSLLAKYAVTHILINKGYYHPDTIPYRKVFEDEWFSVYESAKNIHANNPIKRRNEKPFF